jgi:hypothetical protein
VKELWNGLKFYTQVAEGYYRAPADYRKAVAGPAQRQRARRETAVEAFPERRGRLVLPNPKRQKTAAKKSSQKPDTRFRQSQVAMGMKYGLTRKQAERQYAGRVRRGAYRRNPTLVIANPSDGLPAYLTTWAKRHRLSPAEWSAFRAACARYHTFHGTYPKTIKRTGNVAGSQNRFLVGMGKTVDVTYHAAGKAFSGSSKRGVPWKHEFPSRPTMAVDPATDTILIANPKGRYRVTDFIRG